MPKKRVVAQATPKLITFRVRPGFPADKQLALRVRHASDVTGTPVSQLIREALADKVDELAKRHPELARSAA